MALNFCRYDLTTWQDGTTVRYSAETIPLLQILASRNGVQVLSTGVIAQSAEELEEFIFTLRKAHRQAAYLRQFPGLLDRPTPLSEEAVEIPEMSRDPQSPISPVASRSPALPKEFGELLLMEGALSVS